ncbi:hypothetical protein [Burkholderia sp. Ac-20353]|uniref:hypothetical protein n=1 Tax=Burkholderia sp. Ac-20353 TaxID=2703894 RepID=UPI00197BD342|nr:hypothetical protein [Burkholderia sp. Ac-20353]MBN3792459.1 hypothetical protein [Burkholderia sp. Ac-20353]
MRGPLATLVDGAANYKWNRFHFETFCRNLLTRKPQQSAAARNGTRKDEQNRLPALQSPAVSPATALRDPPITARVRVDLQLKSIEIC